MRDRSHNSNNWCKTIGANEHKENLENLEKVKTNWKANTEYPLLWKMWPDISSIENSKQHQLLHKLRNSYSNCWTLKSALIQKVKCSCAVSWNKMNRQISQWITVVYLKLNTFIYLHMPCFGKPLSTVKTDMSFV